MEMGNLVTVTPSNVQGGSIFVEFSSNRRANDIYSCVTDVYAYPF